MMRGCTYRYTNSEQTFPIITSIYKTGWAGGIFDYHKWRENFFISQCLKGSRSLIFEIDKGNKKYFEFVALKPTGSKAHSLNQKRYFL